MANSRRLVFIAPSAYPLGGVATWLDYLLPGLKDCGWDPILGLVEGKFHDPGIYLAAHSYDRVIRINNFTGSQEGRVRALCKAVLNVDPAIVLSVNIPDAYLAVTRLLKRRKSQAKIAMTLHGIQSDLLGDAYTYRDVLDAVICTNRLTCQLVNEVAGIGADRIHYAPYGVPPTFVETSPDRRDENDRIRIAWVGRLEEDQKRISDIPRILRELDALGQPYEIWIVGDGPEHGRLRERLAPWLQDGRARLMGKLEREAIFAEVYSKADVFLLTSSWETGPIVIWEAMSAGLPVVTSEYIGCGPEGSLIHGDNCLMYPVGDAAGAARCVTALRDPALHQKLSAAGAELVRKRYSVEASITAWDGVFGVIASSERTLQVSSEFPIKPRGRLDRLLGTSAAESVRRSLGIHYSHANAGGEWPHANSGRRLGVD